MQVLPRLLEYQYTKCKLCSPLNATFIPHIVNIVLINHLILKKNILKMSIVTKDAKKDMKKKEKKNNEEAA